MARELEFLTASSSASRFYIFLFQKSFEVQINFQSYFSNYFSIFELRISRFKFKFFFFFFSEVIWLKISFEFYCSNYFKLFLFIWLKINFLSYFSPFLSFELCRHNDFALYKLALLRLEASSVLLFIIGLRSTNAMTVWVLVNVMYKLTRSTYKWLVWKSLFHFLNPLDLSIVIRDTRGAFFDGGQNSKYYLKA